MNIEIVNTGSELMLGRVLNTHQQWLCRQLADMGWVVSRQVAVDDTAEAIAAAVSEALRRADLVITTGGLGPTSDDRTRAVIASLLGVKLRQDEAVLARIQGYFTARKRPMVESTRVQALVPEGATVLLNQHGTAPGLVMQVNDPAGGPVRRLAMLPGPPRELRPMFTCQVAPLLRAAWGADTRFACRTLRTTGLGESLVEERIAPRLEPLTQAGLQLGYCARIGEVDVRLAAAGPNGSRVVAEAENAVRSLLGDWIFGVDDEALEEVVIRELTARRLTVATAESCTGGMISHRLTNVPGASAVFWGGVVSYANAAKELLLGVSPALLAEHGAVSEPVVRAMAEGARRRSGADYALAVTGIAGPGGGSEGKPVGTVFIGLAGPQDTVAARHLNPFDRETFKWATSQQALELLRRALLKQESPPA